jgi:hypothetical protein
MYSIRQLYERIEQLKKDKESLLLEFQELRKQAEKQVVGLECEVAIIRDEIKDLKELLDVA